MLVLCQGLAFKHQWESETRCCILDCVNRRFHEVEEGRDGNGMGLEAHFLPKLILDRCPWMSRQVSEIRLDRGGDLLCRPPRCPRPG